MIYCISLAVVAFCPNNSEVHIYKLFGEKWEKMHVLSKVSVINDFLSLSLFLIARATFDWDICGDYFWYNGLYFLCVDSIVLG